MLTPYVSASPSFSQLDRKSTASEVLGLWATSILVAQRPSGASVT